MPSKARALAILAVTCTVACQLNKDTAPFDNDPNQITPGGSQNANGSAQQPGAQPSDGSGGTPVGGGNAVDGGNVGQDQQGSTPAQNGNAAQTANQTVAPGPRFIGRVPSNQTLSWPGNAVEVRFNGTRASATFSVVTGTSYVAVSVDGGAPSKTLVQNNNAIAVNAGAQGVHTVRFTKLNEPELGVIRFVGISTDGNVLATPPADRRIEFVGDSITVGYGVEGTRPCDNNSSMENVLKAWSGLTGTALNADVSVIAWSGHGLLRNAVGVADSATLPTIWQRTQATDSNATFTFPAATAPQAVVVNLGTNDFTYLASGRSPERSMLDQDAFVAAYAAFVRDIRARYPRTVIVLASSPMLTDTYPTADEAQHSSLDRALNAVQAQLGDANVRVLSIPTMDTEVAACDFHPSTAVHASMSSQLVAELRAALNWQ